MTIAVLVVAACAIGLRGNEDQAQPTASVARKPGPMTAQLEQCRTVTYEQEDALRDCRDLWAHRRRQFLGHSRESPSDPNTAPSRPGSSSAVSSKHETRLPSGHTSIPVRSE
ncbi:putative entry exclusion protein TrbK-alt [Bradyrhizobium sp.]|uniref:putative entry exclusion protein TrbK-alt n=1 Tax=Bradyrhizobium sp. TaxID=376 RepID=UPI0025C2E0A9|nr:putative entry exclusion protein TrbK-alt [Bradyrhizobium sp.]